MVNKIKYAQALKCLYYVGKCSKYLYYAKKVLCVLFVIMAAGLGLSFIAGRKNGCKALGEIF